MVHWIWFLDRITAEAWVVVCVGVALTVFWVFQLLALMKMRGDVFPWLYDKALWFVIVFVGFPLGALVFWIWRKGREIEAKVQRDVAASVAAQRRAAPPDQTPPSSAGD